MKKLYSLSILMLSGLTSMAQPIVSEVNMPVVGDVVNRGICSDIPNASTLNTETGANYSWDFSGLTETSVAAFNFIDPANSYWPTDFANSTMGGEEPSEEAFAFYTVSNAALETDGLRVISAPGDTSEIDYTDSELVLELPATFGNSNSDNFSGSGVAGGFNFSIAGNLQYTIDGHGSLTLPNGSYQNVLRYHADRSETFTVASLPPSTATKEQWIWVSADYRFWLLLMEVIVDPLNGNSTTVWYQKTPIPVTTTGIADSEKSDFAIYPNPALENGTLQLGRTLKADETIQLFDMQGRVVRNVSVSATSVSLSGVRSGLYMLHVLNKNGHAISTQKLIVQ